MVTVNANEISKFQRDVKNFSETFLKTIVEDAIHPFLYVLKRDAKVVHRHIRRTGNLERSVKEKKRSDGGQVFIDDPKCNYGKFVHMGQRTWAPDEFLFDALKKNENDLTMKIDVALDKALRKSGF